MARRTTGACALPGVTWGPPRAARRPSALPVSSSSCKPAAQFYCLFTCDNTCIQCLVCSIWRFLRRNSDIKDYIFGLQHLSLALLLLRLPVNYREWQTSLGIIEAKKKWSMQSCNKLMTATYECRGKQLYKMDVRQSLISLELPLLFLQVLSKKQCTATLTSKDFKPATVFRATTPKNISTSCSQATCVILKEFDGEEMASSSGQRLPIFTLPPPPELVSVIRWLVPDLVHLLLCWFGQAVQKVQVTR